MKDNTTTRTWDRAWLLALILLVAAQTWQTLGLFDPARDGSRLLDDEPILSGRHPLHLYHGYLGARTLLARGRLSCYDPSFHAGYPKTPVFDSGSRPAELMIALVGGHYSPLVYKLTLAGFCVLLPMGVYLAARGTDMSRGVAILVTVLGLAVFWGRPGQDALEAGDLDLLLGSLMLLVQAGFLVRYHHVPGVISLLGIVLAGLIAWFAHPLLALLALPLFLVYYFTVGHRHRLGWHVPLFIGLMVALGANAFWLYDLVTHWWIRIPPTSETPLVLSNWKRWWNAPLWGEGPNKAFSAFLVVTGTIGIVVLHRNGHRASARLFGLAGAGLLGLVLAGISWEPMARLGTAQLLAPALLFITLPAGLALGRALDVVRSWTGTVASPTLLVVSVPGLTILAAPEPASVWARQMSHPRPFEIGLGEERVALLEHLRSNTTPAARILWEDHRGWRKESRWTALLPILTERAFIGGLDADAGIEHAAMALVDGALAGRSIDEWSDNELADYCRKYNIGWIVGLSEQTRSRLARWSLTRSSSPLPVVATERRTLFTLTRTPSFALVGSATWYSADERGILLGNAVPDRQPGDGEGQIVLSLHYQAGMRVRPGRVRIEPAVDSHDTIPFVRLRLQEPVGRILITWEGR